MHQSHPIPHRHSRAVRVLCASAVLAAGPALASSVITNVNGSGTPGDFVFGPSNIGWSWTAPLSFSWDGLGSTFKTCCEFNVLPPNQVVLTIATDTPANGGTTLYSGSLDGAGHASLAPINVTAGQSYFIGLSNLTGNSPYAVGINIVNWVPAQPTGTVNLSGWYTGANFATFFPESLVGGVEQQPFSAPILRFEGVAAVPEPATWLLMALGLGATLGVGGGRGRKSRSTQSAFAPVA